MAGQSNANAVSDLERAEHLGYADSKGVKRVSVFNDGVQVNAATEETLQSVIDPLAKYKPAGMDVSGTPMYFGYIALDGSWYIRALDTASGTTYCKGDSGYDSSWSDRINLTYDEYNVIFS